MGDTEGLVVGDTEGLVEGDTEGLGDNDSSLPFPATTIIFHSSYFGEVGSSTCRCLPRSENFSEKESPISFKVRVPSGPETAKSDIRPFGLGTSRRYPEE